MMGQIYLLWRSSSYVSNVFRANLHVLGRIREIKLQSATIDRNMMVSVLTENLTSERLLSGRVDDMNVLYKHELLFVDKESQEVIYRAVKGGRVVTHMPYDLLIGADGVRSVVRNSLFAQHPNFEVSQSGIFQSMKSIYTDTPDGANPNEFLIVLDQLKNCFIMVIPTSQAGKMNMIVSTFDHQPVDDELLSKDPAVVGRYLSENLKAVKLNEEELSSFAASGWYQTQQLTCSTYHMSVGMGSALILGDAAHATSLALGMGMNTALSDSYELYKLLKANNCDLEVALPLFNEERVKEGQAFTDLSFYTHPLVQSDRIKEEL